MIFGLFCTTCARINEWVPSVRHKSLQKPTLSESFYSFMSLALFGISHHFSRYNSSFGLSGRVGPPSHSRGAQAVLPRQGGSPWGGFCVPPTLVRMSERRSSSPLPPSTSPSAARTSRDDRCCPAVFEKCASICLLYCNLTALCFTFQQRKSGQWLI
jgi:hypothetical protein